jgi:hypothetical protein
MGPHLIHHKTPRGGSSYACGAQSNSMALTEVCISFSLIMSTFPSLLCILYPVCVFLFVPACDVCVAHLHCLFLGLIASLV